jgi:hypothetical protein
MVSLLGVILFVLMPFYSWQHWALLPNEELFGLTKNKSKIYGDGKNEELQFKSVSVIPDVNLKFTDISKPLEYIEAFVQTKTYQKKVRLISPLKLSEQKNVHL